MFIESGYFVNILDAMKFGEIYNFLSFPGNEFY